MYINIPPIRLKQFSIPENQLQPERLFSFIRLPILRPIMHNRFRFTYQMKGNNFPQNKLSNDYMRTTIDILCLINGLRFIAR